MCGREQEQALFEVKRTATVSKCNSRRGLNIDYKKLKNQEEGGGITLQHFTASCRGKNGEYHSDLIVVYQFLEESSTKLMLDRTSTRYYPASKSFLPLLSWDQALRRNLFPRSNTPLSDESWKFRNQELEA
ncbi:hypothetical protein R1flu_000657 [Riccia fluitans]|uniref:Uncharacterized protein n=1 Tax=Riccia fluitans TaxID=41844 RepID=A0ABD1Y416_9MARC